MRYLGNKSTLLDFITQGVPTGNLPGNYRVFDAFAGTVSVGKHFRSLGHYVEANDIMYLSFVLQKAHLECSTTPGRYNELLSYLNSEDVEPQQGYVWGNFCEAGTAHLPQPRKFFLSENAARIDGIRSEIDTLHANGNITTNEHYLMLATLLESVSLYANVSGVYAAFLKTYDPRALKSFALRPIELTTGIVGKANNTNLENGAGWVSTDLLYLDPPYNARQYAPNYHVLETIARGDNPQARGVAGIREYSDLKSGFCSKKTALTSLDTIAEQAEWSCLMLSYSNDGIMETDAIMDTLSKHGKVELAEKPYRRFKSNHGGGGQREHLKEYLYIVTK